MSLTREDRIARAEKALKEGRIIQRAWMRDGGKGRHLVCALAAFSPEAGANKSAAACPADFMPGWLASCIPWLDDSIAVWDVSWLMQGLIDRAKRWHRLSPEQWQNAYSEVRFKFGDHPPYFLRKVSNYPGSNHREAKFRRHAETIFAAIDRQLSMLQITETAEQPAQLTHELPLTIPIISSEKIAA